ncbi:AAA family ATPase [Winogradskyella sediminis]|uniref:AAA domain-containing protein n=1 Tax=Winogradskyella sediminis TaxID=1382466 RepID=A0A1H1SML7_9FLAO|nr:AAA family ATPase [Winogradskyella sediminis]SDS49161.1 AAA domain-containing protein [Winogradskyella sediminis]
MKKIKVKKLIDLINEVEKEPQPKFIWKGIPENSAGLIVGHPKAGKTTLAENLAISLSIGRKSFFGSVLDGIPKKVLFVGLEEPYKLRARRNKLQLSSLNEKEIEHFSNNFDTTGKDFIEFINDENDWKVLRDYIKASEAKIVFIDSLTSMFEGKIEDSNTGRKFTQLFSKYLKPLNKTYILIHHTTKSNEKPMEPSNVAGSRVILQYFEYIYGMSEVPSEEGGYYFCDIQNKHVEKDSTSAMMYRCNSARWMEYLGKENKYILYNDKVKRNVDGRYDDTNENLIYDFALKQYNQGNTYTSTSTMIAELVNGDNKVMSHDTFHKAKNKLIKKGRLEKKARGEFKIVLKPEIENGERK